MATNGLKKYQEVNKPSGPLLFSLSPAFPSFLRKDGPLGDEDDMSTRELLLQFPDNSCLDLLPSLQLWRRYKDHNGLLGPADIYFLGSRDVKFPQMILQVRVNFQFQYRLKYNLVNGDHNQSTGSINSINQPVKPELRSPQSSRLVS